MLAAIIILAITLAVLLFFLIVQIADKKSISQQLDKIRSEETNQIVHSTGSGKVSDELISQINLLLKEMQKIRTDYHRKNHALEQMMTNISHDLRTPLTSALGYIQLLKSSDLSEEEKDRELAVIEKRLGRLEELINSFFEFSRIISSEKLPEITEINAVAVIEDSIANYYDDYTNRSRCIILRCPANRLMISSNRNMLCRIFDNLISNALKHGKGDLTITAAQNDVLKFTFSNTTDDPAVDIHRVFDEFYTTDISRTKGNTGLGLAIAKQFTNMLSGSISAELDNGVFAVTVIF